MQERYEVARVKTEGQFGEHHKLDRREIYPVNGSKNIYNSSENIDIYLVRLSDKGWEEEKWTKKSRNVTH